MSAFALSTILVVTAASGAPQYQCSLLDASYGGHQYRLALSDKGTPIDLVGELFPRGSDGLRFERGRVNEEVVVRNSGGKLVYLVSGFAADEAGQYVGLTISRLDGKDLSPQIPLLSGMCVRSEGAPRPSVELPVADAEVFENTEVQFVDGKGTFLPTSISFKCLVETFDGAREDLAFAISIDKPENRNGAVTLEGLSGAFAARIGPERNYKGYYSQASYADLERVERPQLRVNTFLDSKGGKQKVTIIVMMAAAGDGLLPTARIEERQGKVKRTLGAGFCDPVMKGVQFIEYNGK